MRATAIFLSLALVGSVFSPQPLEGQYPLLDPDEPCYKVMWEVFLIPLDAQAEIWGEPDDLAFYYSGLLRILKSQLATIKEYKPDEEWTKEEREAELSRLSAAKNCLPTLVAMIRRIDERLKLLGIDQIMDASRRHVAREEVTKQLEEATKEYEAALEVALKSLGVRG
ncbi:hypothetical protein ACFL3S_04295 [Gemmatimonadota bacterium]